MIVFLTRRSTISPIITGLGSQFLSCQKWTDGFNFYMTELQTPKTVLAKQPSIFSNLISLLVQKSH